MKNPIMQLLVRWERHFYKLTFVVPQTILFLTVVLAAGEVVERLPYFSECLQKMSLRSHPGRLLNGYADRLELLRNAIVIGISEYLRISGSSKALIGLSREIDSAVVATLATQALGKENIPGLALPGSISTYHSLEDARKLAETLQIDMRLISIGDVLRSRKNFNHSIGSMTDLTSEIPPGPYEKPCSDQPC